MDLGMQGRAAIVTGAGRGIGAAIAVELARQGCDVAIVDSGPIESAREVSAQIEEVGRRAPVLQVDVRDFEEAERTVAAVAGELGRLDILVCNAGIARDGVAWKLTEEAWDTVIDVNLKGCFNYCRAAASVFKAQGSGKIVTISSINGLRGKFGQSNYAASKGGIIALTKTLARELGAFDVNVNAVAPGMVRTGMVERVPEKFLKAAVAETVLGRIATPEDVAHLVAFLCSDYARHITGEVVTIDGGQYM